MPMSVTYYNVNGQIAAQKAGSTYTEFIPDPLGNVIACRNSSGTITHTAEYWPYGEVRTTTGFNPSPWAFCGTWGYRQDPGGQMYVRARYYRPTLSRWQTVDPLWPHESSFGYAKKAPVYKADYSGKGLYEDYFNRLFPPSEGAIPYWVLPSGLNPFPPNPLDKPYSSYFSCWGEFQYGNCCGFSKKCGSSSKAFDCTDIACRAHDVCVGAEWIQGALNWRKCNKKFCNDLEFCKSKACSSIRLDVKQCRAIDLIMRAFCNTA